MKKCSIENCSNKHEAKGYCNKHYQKFLTYGDALYGWEKHGISAPQEHTSWSQMIQRCTNSNNIKFPRYGGRGIKICERWRRFENFYKDIGPKPTPKHSIDRIDNDGNYEPGNCRWATRVEQANNTSRNVPIIACIKCGSKMKRLLDHSKYQKYCSRECYLSKKVSVL